MPPRLITSNPNPRKSQGGTFLMNADHYRRRAAQLCKNPSPKAQEIALGHEQMARMLDHRAKHGA